MDAKTSFDLLPAEPAAVAQLDLVLPLSPDHCPVTVYLANDLTSVAGRQTMLSNLRRAARVLSGGKVDDPRLVPWYQLGQQHVARLRALLLEQGAAPSSVNTVLSGVKGVLRQCWRLGLLTHEQFARATDVKAAKGTRVDRTGRCLADGEVRALFGVCAEDTSPAGLRDAAVLALALHGLRRAELSALQVDDFTRPAGQPHGQLIVRGKGNKERKVFISNGALEALEDWLALRGAEPGALFVPINKGGHLALDGGLTGQAIAAMIAKRATQAGAAKFSPHDCRRTCVSGLLDAGVDISTAAQIAGHASVETTRIYDRRGERAAVAAAGTVHIPYKRK